MPPWYIRGYFFFAFYGVNNLWYIGDGEGCSQISSKLCLWFLRSYKYLWMDGLTNWRMDNAPSHKLPRTTFQVSWKSGSRGVYRRVSPQNRYLLSSQKLHSQFRWNFITAFNTHDVLKFVQEIKKTHWGQMVSTGRSWAQNIYLLSSLKPKTQFRWNLTPTFITHDEPKCFHTINK